MKTLSQLVMKHYNTFAATVEGDQSVAFFAGARAAYKAMKHVQKRKRRRERTKK